MAKTPNYLHNRHSMFLLHSLRSEVGAWSANRHMYHHETVLYFPVTCPTNLTTPLNNSEFTHSNDVVTSDYIQSEKTNDR
uniref:Ovule protein n=1 Tax=Loa loa TaxID=7209 RepID=A0A1I7VQK0_LOALO